MLLDRCFKQGYTVYIQGDADGKDSTIFRDLCQKGAITQDHAFVFRHDFESAIPPDLLYEALGKLGKLEGVKYDEFKEVAKPKDGSVLKILGETFGKRPAECILCGVIG